MILAIDLGTKMGWAFDAYFYAHRQQVIMSGMENFTPKPPTKTRAKEHIGQRFARFEEWLDEFPEYYEVPNAVLYERVDAHNGTRAAHVYGGYLSILLAWAFSNNVPVRGVAVGTIKKSATGSGRAKKPEMIEAAIELAGYEITDDNQADTVCLLHTEIEKC